MGPIQAGPRNVLAIVAKATGGPSLTRRSMAAHVCGDDVDDGVVVGSRAKVEAWIKVQVTSLEVANPA